MWMCDDTKPWLEVTMEETVTLLRKKLEKMNDLQEHEVGSTVLQNLNNLYKTLYYIGCIHKNMKVLETLYGSCNSWLNTEMKESLTLLRKKLTTLNSTDVESVNTTVLTDFKNAYKTVYYIFSLSKDSSNPT